MRDVVHACYMMANDEDPDTDFISGGLLAIVDTACVRTVAGYDWFEKFCEMCDYLSFEVKTFDHEEYFRFGASRVYTSLFGVIAWFATQDRWFAVRVAIVPCKVPLLFSRPILAGLGMTYDVAAQKVQLNALSLADVPLLSSPIGHPALNVSEFTGNKHPPWPDDAKELYIPSERAYMGAPTSTDSDIVKPLFYPKKLSKEVEHMFFSQERLGGPGFICWWKGIKQSRDFWVETEQEFVRVHIVLRRHLFDPSTWNTRLTGLKDVLLKCIGQRRITEACLCLAGGNLVEVHEGDREGNNELFLDGPWMERSRWLEIKPIKECCLTPLPAPRPKWSMPGSTSSPWNMKKSVAARGIGKEGSQCRSYARSWWSNANEQRQLEKPAKKEDRMRGLTKMTLAQLVC